MTWYLAWKVHLLNQGGIVSTACQNYFWGSFLTWKSLSRALKPFLINFSRLRDQKTSLMIKILSLDDYFFHFYHGCSCNKMATTHWKFPSTKNENFQVGFFSPHFSGFGNYLKKQFWKNERGLMSHSLYHLISTLCADCRRQWAMRIADIHCQLPTLIANADCRRRWAMRIAEVRFRCWFSGPIFRPGLAHS